MSYAELPDVKARAGRVGNAWTVESDPSTTDIERFLDDGAALIDSKLAARGFGTPASDPVVAAALRPLNAAYALFHALDATFQGGTAPDEVVTVRNAAEKEWGDWTTSMDEGTATIIEILSGTSTGPLATNFWSEEPDYGSPGAAELPEDSNYRLAPYIARGDRF